MCGVLLTLPGISAQPRNGTRGGPSGGPSGGPGGSPGGGRSNLTDGLALDGRDSGPGVSPASGNRSVSIQVVSGLRVISPIGQRLAREISKLAAQQEGSDGRLPELHWSVSSSPQDLARGEVLVMGQVESAAWPMVRAHDAGNTSWLRALDAAIAAGGSVPAELKSPPPDQPGGTTITGLLLLYRRDWWRKLPASGPSGTAPPPPTWPQFVSLLASLLNEDLDGNGDTADHVLCIDIMPSCKGWAVLSAIFSSIMQTQGLRAGQWFDKSTMIPNIGNPALSEAMRLFAQLAASNAAPFTPHGLSRSTVPVSTTDLRAAKGELDPVTQTPLCSSVNPLFAAGRCLFTIDWATSALALTQADAPRISGSIAAELLPGSTTFLDPEDNVLKPCTREDCPLAELLPAALSASPSAPQQEGGGNSTGGLEGSAGVGSPPPAVPSPADGTVAAPPQKPNRTAAVPSGVPMMFVNRAPFVGEASSVWIPRADPPPDNITRTQVNNMIKQVGFEVSLKYGLLLNLPYLKEGPPVANADGSSTCLFAPSGLSYLSQVMGSTATALAAEAVLGMSSEDLQVLVQAVSRSYTHPNAALDMNLPRSALYRQVMDDLASAAMALLAGSENAMALAQGQGQGQGRGSPRGRPPKPDLRRRRAQAQSQEAELDAQLQALAAVANDRFTNITNEFPYPSILRAIYRLPATPKKNTTEAPAATSHSNRSLSLGLPIGVGVGCGLLVVCVAAAVGVLLLRKKKRRQAAKPPGPGPATTLALTDVQNSTLLWETLPPGLMDVCLGIHHRTLRQAIADNRGFECFTEGDAFAVAFHGPDDALGFAMDLQVALLAADWPQALLLQPDGCELWAQSVVAEPATDNLTQRPSHDLAQRLSLTEGADGAGPGSEAASSPRQGGSRRLDGPRSHMGNSASGLLGAIFMRAPSSPPTTARNSSMSSSAARIQPSPSMPLPLPPAAAAACLESLATPFTTTSTSVGATPRKAAAAAPGAVCVLVAAEPPAAAPVVSPGAASANRRPAILEARETVLEHGSESAPTAEPGEPDTPLEELLAGDWRSVVTWDVTDAGPVANPALNGPAKAKHKMLQTSKSLGRQAHSGHGTCGDDDHSPLTRVVTGHRKRAAVTCHAEERPVGRLDSLRAAVARATHSFHGVQARAPRDAALRENPHRPSTQQLKTAGGPGPAGCETPEASADVHSPHVRWATNWLWSKGALGGSKRLEAASLGLAGTATLPDSTRDGSTLDPSSPEAIASGPNGKPGPQLELELFSGAEGAAGAVGGPPAPQRVRSTLGQSRRSPLWGEDDGGDVRTTPGERLRNRLGFVFQPVFDLFWHELNSYGAVSSSVGDVLGRLYTFAGGDQTCLEDEEDEEWQNRDCRRMDGRKSDGRKSDNRRSGASRRLTSRRSTGGLGGVSGRLTAGILGTMPNRFNKPRAQLVLRGLRVRVGMTSGLDESEVETVDRNGMQTVNYAGDFLATAKEISDAAVGGMVLMSGSAFLVYQQLRNQPQPKAGSGAHQNVMVLHLGEHVAQRAADASVYPLASSASPQRSIYCAVSPGLAVRLALLQPLVRHHWEVVPGCLSAPAGMVAPVFCNVAGVETLLAWERLAIDRAERLASGSSAGTQPRKQGAGPTAAFVRAALDLFCELANQAASRHNGYVVAVSSDGGHWVLVFPNPVKAVQWGLEMLDAMLKTEWPEGFLDHELTEEVLKDGVLVKRGLRLRIGIDYGRAMVRLVPRTGRLDYVGRPMNRAARIAAKAKPATVLASGAAWEAASGALEPRVAATGLGCVPLKGVREPMVLWALASKRDMPAESFDGRMYM
ncbi:hypothetical protein HYH03_007492 [Edaphochlamys debaryana]|uniref:Guanylate cyclase domain-containing protein n=1 Tax=Edaphochlamys debaryana TaxID=47281 RepID=A0A836BZ93_9CHLO|nr:hypothetical protein HYH03_007492 [Edaphochlamys debaryana]|eukprot:KAG2494440.1 hypothetical protein HYH03_007492 [Edaphochlamys debaryana]